MDITCNSVSVVLLFLSDTFLDIYQIDAITLCTLRILVRSNEHRLSAVVTVINGFGECRPLQWCMSILQCRLHCSLQWPCDVNWSGLGSAAVWHSLFRHHRMNRVNSHFRNDSVTMTTLFTPTYYFTIEWTIKSENSSFLPIMLSNLNRFSIFLSLDRVRNLQQKSRNILNMLLKNSDWLLYARICEKCNNFTCINIINLA